MNEKPVKTIEICKKCKAQLDPEDYFCLTHIHCYDCCDCCRRCGLESISIPRDGCECEEFDYHRQNCRINFRRIKMYHSVFCNCDHCYLTDLYETFDFYYGIQDHYDLVDFWYYYYWDFYELFFSYTEFANYYWNWWRY